MKNSEDIQKFKDQLESYYTFPAIYPFKFIVPNVEAAKIKELAKGAKVSENPSKSGKFISFSFKKNVNSSDEIIEIYLKANKIKGIVSL